MDLTKLKISNDKAWKLVEELEKENTALVNGNVNAFNKIKELEDIIKKEEYEDRKLIKKYKIENEFLRRIAVSNSPLTRNEIGIIIKSILEKQKREEKKDNQG